jgi:small-conductance mechanosensitive channel
MSFETFQSWLSVAGDFLATYTLPVFIIVGSTLVGWLLEIILTSQFRRFIRRVRRVKEIEARRTFRFRFILMGLLTGILSIPPYLKENLIFMRWNIIELVIIVLLIFVATITISQFSVTLLRMIPLPDSQESISLVANIIRAVIYSLGFLISLSFFNLSITPFLAALGVTGLAVSLALQATLTDLISGIQILATRQIGVGDYVKVYPEHEGYVLDIGWRTTKIRELTNNVVILPNSTLTSHILTNYYEPEPELIVLLNVEIDFNNDLKKVEQICSEAGQQVMRETEGGVPDFIPFIRYGAIQNNAITFIVILKAKEFLSQYLIKHEFILRLNERFRAEDIKLPAPAHTIYLQNESQSKVSPNSLSS